MNSKNNDNTTHLVSSGGRRKLSAKKLPIPQDLSWTMSDLSSEEDSRREMRYRFQMDESRDTVHRQIYSMNSDECNDSSISLRDEGPSQTTTNANATATATANTATREGDDCLTMPYLDDNESDDNNSPESVNLVLRRCHAWSQDSMDRRRSLERSTMSSTTRRYGRSDSILIDSSFGSCQILEESPTSTWVYWEEQLDNEDFTFRESLMGRAPIV